MTLSTRDFKMAEIRTPENSDDEEEGEFVEETVLERLWGLTEMIPDRYWKIASRLSKNSYSYLRGGTWILATSMAILFLPPLIEFQRVELEEAHKQQSKQLLFGEGAVGAPRSSFGGLGIPPPTPGS